MKIRESRTMSDYSELEEENVVLQKQLAGLKHAQVHQIISADKWFTNIRHNTTTTALNGSDISCWWTPQSDGHRLVTATEVSVNVDARRTVDAPFHHRWLCIFRRGFVYMEPVVQRHLVTVFRQHLKTELFLRSFGPDCVWRFLYLHYVWLRTRPFRCKMS